MTFRSFFRKFFFLSFLLSFQIGQVFANNGEEQFEIFDGSYLHHGTEASSQVNYSFSDKEVQEQAYVDLFRGASQVALPFVLPPGVNGFSPSLYLSYSSQRVLETGFIGYGWDLPLGFVQRLNKDGIDQMYLEPTYSISLGNLQGELALLDTIGNVQRYGLKTESDFARIDFNTTDNRWEVSL